MKRIYLTVDVECHGIEKRNIYIDGFCKKGSAGLERILLLGDELEIPVNFFVDVVEEKEYGRAHVASIVNMIESHGQKVYFHLHPKFITGLADKDFLWMYSYEEKKKILQEGFEIYKNITGKEADFFRIGRYGADPEMYQAMADLGRKPVDLSYCYRNKKMCHLTETEAGTKNAVRKINGITVFPNTRYLGFHFAGIKKYFNTDVQETTINEWKRFLDKNKQNQTVLTMHSWNFIVQWFFLKKHAILDTKNIDKFKKMISYARSKGYVFCSLEEFPPDENSQIDEVVDLCDGNFGKIKMILNNYIRFGKIARTNIRYFMIYFSFYIVMLCLILWVIRCCIYK